MINMAQKIRKQNENKKRKPIIFIGVIIFLRNLYATTYILHFEPLLKAKRTSLPFNSYSLSAWTLLRFAASSFCKWRYSSSSISFKYGPIDR